MPTSPKVNSLAFFASELYDCGYLEGNTAVSVFADPSVAMSTAIYSKLIDYGFRRSGEHVYAPRCPDCSACVPIRVPVMDFTPNRTQRRTVMRNAQVTVTCRFAEFRDEHFKLYKRYISSRHSGGSMNNPTPDSYMQFLTSRWSETYFYEFRLQNQLLAVTVADKVHQGLSAVYTFFEPEYATLSPRQFAVISLINEARSLRLPWLYLGYWIANCRKMQYKDQYRPAEIFHHGRWYRYKRNQVIPH